MLLQTLARTVDRKRYRRCSVLQQLSPKGVWTSIYEQDINHLIVWGYQVIPNVDIKSMASHTRKDKFVSRGRKAFFVGYINETTY